MWPFERSSVFLGLALVKLASLQSQNEAAAALLWLCGGRGGQELLFVMYHLNTAGGPTVSTFTLGDSNPQGTFTNSTVSAVSR